YVAVISGGARSSVGLPTTVVRIYNGGAFGYSSPLAVQASCFMVPEQRVIMVLIRRRFEAVVVLVLCISGHCAVFWFLRISQIPDHCGLGLFGSKGPFRLVVICTHRGLVLESVHVDRWFISLLRCGFCTRTWIRWIVYV
ncbi:hypothetical protein A2U01_0048801, partial [Trifolium medium]|nr:hypothetical protein [Trifolium medium]